MNDVATRPGPPLSMRAGSPALGRALVVVASLLARDAAWSGATAEPPAPVATTSGHTAPAGVPATPVPPRDPLLVQRGCWTIKFGLSAGAQVAGEEDAFWGLSDAFAPGAGYSKERVWGELWAIPSVRVTRAVSSSLGLYGGLAVAATGNLGHDVFEQGDSGRISSEQAFGGLRLSSPRADATLDVSGGQQPYRLGTGMLVDLGAQNGGPRGAALVSPRRSWEWSGLAQVTVGRLSADAFVLNYNEISSTDPDTTLVGGKVEYLLSAVPRDEFLGLAYVRAVDSSMPYVQAPLTLIDGGREDTQTVNAYLRVRPHRRALPGLYAALEGAYQWNGRIDLSAYALSAEVGYQWEHAAWRPTLSYAFRRFSGDDPGTRALERFDPLFYDGGVHAFASGSNGALTFYNTNVQVHRLSLGLTASPRDVLTFSYWRLDAVETESPLQFGQAGRVVEIGGQPVLVAGVQTKHLSDDFYAEYVRVLTAHAYLTFGLGFSLPGSGLEGLPGGSVDPWLGGLVNLTFQF